MGRRGAIGLAARDETPDRQWIATYDFLTALCFFL